MDSKDKRRYLETVMSDGGGERHLLYSQLEPDEEVIYETRTHWLLLVPAFALALLLSRLTSGLSLVLALPVVYAVKNFEYFVTDKRILTRSGFFKVRQTEVPIACVTSVEVSQNAFTRLLGIGDVTVRAGDGETRYRLIEDPQSFRHYIGQAGTVKAKRERRALILGIAKPAQ